MIPQDLIVEVRDKSLTRVGMISPKDFNLMVNPMLNAVGQWTVTLPVDHPMADALNQPGAGIVISTNNAFILSGSVQSPSNVVSSDDFGGSVTFTGACDNQNFWDRLCYPNPAKEAENQDRAFATYSNNAETVIYNMVDDNLGPSALADRQLPQLSMGDNGGAGDTATRNVCFENLGDTIANVANSRDLMFRIVDTGGGLEFRTSAVSDRSDLIRLDTARNTLAGYNATTAAPTATHAIVGHQYTPDDTTQQFQFNYATVTSDDSVQAADDWNRRIETFVNQDYEVDQTAWTEQAVDLLKTAGVTSINVQATANDDDSEMTFGVDFDLGDYVSVIVDGQELKSQITGFIITANSDQGVQFGLVFGDASGFNPTRKLRSAVENLHARLSRIETKGSNPTAPIQQALVTTAVTAQTVKTTVSRTLFIY